MDRLFLSMLALALQWFRPRYNAQLQLIGGADSNTVHTAFAYRRESCCTNSEGESGTPSAWRVAGS